MGPTPGSDAVYVEIASHHWDLRADGLRRVIRRLIVTFMALLLSFGWLLPIAAAPITATVCLRDSFGVGISGAEAFVSAGSFVSLGLTDATGCVSTDLASALGNRTFRILHRGLTLNKTQNTSTNPLVVFQTVAVNLRLLDSTGVGISGAPIEFNGGTWQSLGATDATGTVTTELLGLNTSFRVTHRGLTVTKSQNTSTNPNVVFQTVPVTVRLLDSTGTVGIPGAAIDYNPGTWQNLGTTDATGTVTTELLGLSTRFRVIHRGLTVSKSQNTSTNPNVVFQTVPVTVRLLDSTGTVGIPGATVEYNASGWQNLGTTNAAGTVTADLLGLNTTFRVTHVGQTQNKTQNTTTNPNVVYQTGRVLQGTGPRILAWFASGWHPFTNGAELLPGSVTFDFNTGPNQPHTVVAGATIYVPVAPTAPVVNALDQSAIEGQSLALSSVAFIDQEAGQTHRATIDWGDGSAPAAGLVVQANGLAGTVTGSHVFADDGTYTVQVCVSDDGNPDAAGCDTLQVTVANLAPVVTILGAGSGAEGTEVALSSLVADVDPVTLSWVVSLNSATIATGTGPDIAFTPADEGLYDVSVTADDGDGGPASASRQVAVANLDPSVAITGSPNSVAEDQVVTLGSVGEDPGLTDVLALAWNVTLDAAPVAIGSGADFSFTPDQAGSYVVTLVVSDGDGGSATAQVVIEVIATPLPDPAPTPSASAPATAPEPEQIAADEPTPTATAETHSRSRQPASASDITPISTATTLPDSPQPEGEPGTTESEPIFNYAGAFDHLDQVMLLALSAGQTADSITFDPSMGLILSLIWLGPTLVVLARTRLRREAE